MKEIKVRLTLTDEMLGTSAADPEIYRKYIASKSPDSKTIEEEIAAIGEDEVFANSLTIFPKEEGVPFIWDYQLRGFFKAACSALRKCGNAEIAKESNKLKAFKKIIDCCIFVYPRKIPICMHEGEMGICERPLRANTPQGERVALAASETVPQGSTMDCTICCLNDDHENVVKEWLNYGKYNGLLQWRNSGKGRFVWEEV